tara:strand:- start:223 stop:420 length:198 start_codon:yes stop_codon:yes gene_type:complete
MEDKLRKIMDDSTDHQTGEVDAEIAISKLLVLFDGMNGFYDWHKEKGYITLKRDDFEEYLNSLKK